jgi:hypothetical protein
MVAAVAAVPSSASLTGRRARAKGDLFFTDVGRQCIYRMDAAAPSVTDPRPLPDATRPRWFAAGFGSGLVDITVGLAACSASRHRRAATCELSPRCCAQHAPDGALWAVSYIPSQIFRISARDTVSVTLVADVMAGAVPLTVQLTATASSTAGGGIVQYRWCAGAACALRARWKSFSTFAHAQGP